MLLLVIDRIALALTVIGALNWGIVGIFKYDILSHMFGGHHTTISRIILTLIGLAGIWAVSLLFRRADRVE